METRILLKNGSVYSVNAYYDDVVTDWRTKQGVVEYERLGAGLPTPKVAILMEEVASVEQTRW